MNAREIRALEIASLSPVIKQKNGRSLVSSLTNGEKEYSVSLDPNSFSCDCPDFVARQLPCKHQMLCLLATVVRDASEQLSLPLLARIVLKWLSYVTAANDALSQKIIDANLARIEGKTDEVLSVVRVLAETKQAAVKAEQSEPKRPKLLTIKQAAEMAGVCYEHVRRAILSGDLVASNLGRGHHAIYRISPESLQTWIERKKGGNNVPPRSELQELIDRHLPGLRR